MSLRVKHLSKGNLHLTPGDYVQYMMKQLLQRKIYRPKPAICCSPPGKGKYKKNLSVSSATITTVPNEPLE